jgi:hypothetical protein
MESGEGKIMLGKMMKEGLAWRIADSRASNFGFGGFEFLI